MPPIPSEYGGEVTVFESSAASGPHIWLKAREAMRGEPERTVALHLTAENAWRLAEQLQMLVRDHYQGDATPEQTSYHAWPAAVDGAPLPTTTTDEPQR